MLKIRTLGVTLVELLVSMLVFGVLATVVFTLFIRQQRFHIAVRGAVGAQRALYDGAELLRRELRAVSPTDSGLSTMASDQIGFRSLLGTSVLCGIDSARTEIHVPTRDVADGALTSWVSPPQVGDTVLVYHPLPDSSSGHWSKHVLAADPITEGECPPATGLTDNSLIPGPALQLRLAPQLLATTVPGTVLRFVRGANYLLYRASDAHWYLGFFDCLTTRATPCAAVQPVSGPYLSDGVHFTYRDAAGTETSNPTQVARIDVRLRAEQRRPLGGSNIPRPPLDDSLSIVITPRN